ncbi:MAG: xanthine dehydrogenase family protein molybdopterin-binding subunit [Saprospiraceae bacterium]|nr:xanthine dehydrogenase family protein molybdopterin-binding subunit [Saprospiraceae bacterium]
MTKVQTTYKRRSFLKVSAAAGGGMILGFNWLMGCKPEGPLPKAIPSEWFDINAFLKIGDTGLVTIYSPNPEIGQNIKTSMPMIVAEELDVNWHDVVVEQAGLNTEWYTRQVAGGSQSIRQGWESLRMAGATARKMLVDTAAEQWGVNAEDCSVANGIISGPNNESIGYGEIAQLASQREVPEEVDLKDPNDFKIIGKSQTNVDLQDIITGKPLFGLDVDKEGMVYAVVLRPPAFGYTLESFDDTDTKAINGVSDVVQFGDKIAVIASNTWAAIKGQKALKAEWKVGPDIEDSAYHDKELLALLDKKADEARREDGDVFAAFDAADEIFERTYEAPFLPHSCLEPMNFYADVNETQAYFLGPIQTPEWTRNRLSKLLDRDPSEIKIDMTRMGGGFGRRLYGDFALEAAEISKLIEKPVKLTFTREDDMTAGTYRPASKFKFKTGIKDGKIDAWYMVETCINGRMWDPMPSNFPAGTIDNFRVDSHVFESNITTGAWRAPYANFLAYAEQAYIDELAMHLGKDPIDLRLELFERARTNPVGEAYNDDGDKFNYDIDKYTGVIKLAREKSNWDQPREGVHLGFSAYYSHNTYVAEVAEVEMENGMPVVKKIICCVDCGIVVNPIAAKNQVEGGIIDGIGHAMYGQFDFEKGRTQQTNYDTYRLIRISEVPEIEVHFVESQNDPTGLGEPTLPPAGGAIANAFAAASGQRFYKQPFVNYKDVIG